MWNYNQTGYLSHHGIIGQRWGVRRTQAQLGNTPKKEKASPYDHTNELDTIFMKTKNGAVLSLSRNKTPAMARMIAKHNPKVRAELQKSDVMSIKVGDKKVGDLELYKESPSSINIVWVGVNNKERGQGYQTAVMNGVIKYAKDTNCKQVTLEVPGSSPDARHVYEKLGFRAGKQISGSDDVWGGLTKMKLDL